MDKSSKSKKQSTAASSRQKNNTASDDRSKIDSEWFSFYQELMHFRNKFGNCSVPIDDPNDPLCAWANRQKQTYWRGKLSKDKIDMLSRIGFEWGAAEEAVSVNEEETAADAVGGTEAKPSRPRLSKTAIQVLQNWLDQHESHPFPSKEDKLDLISETGLCEQQVNSWFLYQRRKRGLKRQPKKHSEHVIQALTLWYDEHGPFPEKEDRMKLMTSTDLSEQQIKAWFQAERRRRGDPPPIGNKFPEAAVDVLRSWYDEHESDPFASREQKHELMKATNLSEKQVSDWLACERARRYNVVKIPEFASKHLKRWYDAHEPDETSKEEKKILMVATKLTETQIDTWLKNEYYKREDGKPSVRLSLSAVKVLETWYNEHKSAPYPSKEEKTELAAATGCTEKQVYNWLSSQRYTRGDVEQPRKVAHPHSSVAVLKKWYNDHEADDVYPTKEEKTQLASESLLSEQQVEQWFLSERTKRKRAGHEIKGSRKRAKGRSSSRPQSTIDALNELYAKNPYPSKEDKDQLAHETNLSEKQVQAWLTRERARRGDSTSNIDSSSSDYLKSWYDAHQSNPYPSNKTITSMASKTNRTEQQIRRWFTNERTSRKKAVIENLNKMGFDTPFAYLKNWYRAHDMKCPDEEEKVQLLSITGLLGDDLDEWFERKSKKKSESRHFSQSTIDALNDRYTANKYPTKEEQVEIASAIGLSEYQVKSWFTAERARRKKAGASGLRDRSDLTSLQSDYLKEKYASTTHPSKAERQKMADAIGSSENRVNEWFRNMRTRHKKAVGGESQRFSEQASNHLRTWHSKHKSKQYPTRSEKEKLARATGLTVTQIAAWFANKRAKQKKAAKAEEDTKSAEVETDGKDTSDVTTITAV